MIDGLSLAISLVRFNVAPLEYHSKLILFCGAVTCQESILLVRTLKVALKVALEVWVREME
jgi:hypothetical protein